MFHVKHFKVCKYFAILKLTITNIKKHSQYHLTNNRTKLLKINEKLTILQLFCAKLTTFVIKVFKITFLINLFLVK